MLRVALDGENVADMFESSTPAEQHEELLAIDLLGRDYRKAVLQVEEDRRTIEQNTL